MRFDHLDRKFAEADTSMDRNNEIAVPDGIYRVAVVGADFKETQTRKQLFIWTFKVIEGNYIDTTIEKTVLLREDLLKWLKIDIHKCGWKAQSVTEIYEGRDRLVGLELDIKLTTKNDRQNIWIHKLITGDETVEQDPPRGDRPPPPGDDDIPF